VKVPVPQNPTTQPRGLPVQAKIGRAWGPGCGPQYSFKGWRRK